MIFFARTLKNALKKTRDSFTKKFKDVLLGKVDAERLEAMEKLFFEADLGSEMSLELIDLIESQLRKSEIDEVRVKEVLHRKLLSAFPQSPGKVQFQQDGPTVLFLVGINGAGKTTTLAKLAHFYQNQGKSVMIAAADTFRAAASDQLEIWAKRANCPIVKGSLNADPSSVIFDAITSAKAKNIDLVLVDTAGRLQTKTDLMQELEKMKRVASRVIASAPHEVLFILDATSGQNGLSAAENFNQFIPLTSVVLTKIDSTAKGGIAVSIVKKLNVPISFLGTGEKIDDFDEFDPAQFIDALLD